MFINLWEFYRKIDNQLKFNQIYEQAWSLVENVVNASNSHHTLKMCARFYMLEGELKLKDK